MNNNTTGSDTMRSFLVLAATIGVIVFNWLAATGRLGGIDTGAISDKYQTLVTPAGYAFSIWTLIYAGLIAFSIYQLIPANVTRFNRFRSLYIFSCALNCAWLYFWHQEQIVICFAIIFALCLTLFAINYLLRDHRSTAPHPKSLADTWLVRGSFGIYFGWVTAAMLVNFAIMLKYLNALGSAETETIVAVVLILVAGALGVLIRIRLTNYFYPLAIAWALTAIAVKQSGQTAVVVACAVGVVACLIASLSFVVGLKGSEFGETPS